MGTRNGSGASAGSRISIRESVEVVAGGWNGAVEGQARWLISRVWGNFAPQIGGISVIA